MLLSLLPDSSVLRNFEYLIPHSLFPPHFEGFLEEKCLSIFMLQYNSQHQFSFFHLPSFLIPYHSSILCPSHFPTLITGVEFGFVFKGRPFAFSVLCTFLLPQNDVLLDIPVYLVTPCTKVPYCLRTEYYKSSKRTFHIVSVFLILKVDSVLVLNNFTV